MICYDISAQKVLDIPMTAEMDFLELASVCEMLVSELIECDYKTERMALNGKLSLGLERLHAALLDPVSPGCAAKLAANELPSSEPFCLGSDVLMLTSYCQSLSSSLLAGALSPPLHKGLTGLLFDLVHHLHDNLRSPCYTRSTQGFHDRDGKLVIPVM